MFNVVSVSEYFKHFEIFLFLTHFGGKPIRVNQCDGAGYGDWWDCSTEEILAGIEKINVTADDDGLVIFSTDVEQMHPALHISTVAEVVAKEFLNSKLETDLVWVELSLYLAVIHSRQKLVDMCLGHMTHTCVGQSNNRPGITTKEILDWGDSEIQVVICHRN